MSWPCFMVEKVNDRFKYNGVLVAWMEVPPGAMWFSGELLFVRLPRGLDWCVDRPGKNGCRWNRSGDAPNVSVTPSINFEGLYHGHVSAGRVTDDVEGRKFDELGKLITA